MKRILQYFVRRIPRIFLFLGLFLVLYGIFGGVLIFHAQRSYIDRVQFREALKLDKEIYQLNLKKDSIYQAGINGNATTQLMAELKETDNLISKRQADHRYVYSKAHIRKLNTATFLGLQEWPYYYLRSWFKPTLPILPVLCLILAIVLYKPAWQFLTERYKISNL